MGLHEWLFEMCFYKELQVERRELAERRAFARTSEDRRQDDGALRSDASAQRS